MERFFKGIIVGLGGVAPGLSGSVLLIIFGLYQKTLDALGSLLKDFRKNIRFLLPLVVGITYEINRLVGRYDNWFTRILSAPGLWMQNFTTNEPDDSMIEVGIAAVQAVLPEEEGADRW